MTMSAPNPELEIRRLLHRDLVFTLRLRMTGAARSSDSRHLVVVKSLFTTLLDVQVIC